MTAAVPGAAKKPADREELFNPLLGIEHSHWLTGPIYHIANEEEIEAYLALTGDEEAERFIDAFWARRNEGTDFFEETPEEIYRRRLEEADSRFREGAVPGSRTDRGIVFVLYGEPEEIVYDSPHRRGGRPIEVWEYPEDAAAGLDGEEPERRYRFVEIDGETVRYRSNLRDRRLRIPPPPS